MAEKGEQSEQIWELPQALPVERQKAVCWLVKNIDIADRLSEDGKMTSEEIEELTQRALDTKDDIMLALVKYKQAKDRYETENKEQEI